jgi:hypothetical protein
MLLLIRHCAALLLLSACAADRTGAAPAASLTHAVACDPSATIARHRAAFGDARARALPVSLRATIRRQGSEGTRRYALDQTRYIGVESYAGLVGAAGADDQGPWSLDADVFVRLRADEARGQETFPWVLRGGYLDALERGEAVTRCEAEGQASILVMTLDAPRLGNPVLRFDATSGALLSVSSDDARGRAETALIQAWGPPDTHSVRTPSRVLERSALGEETAVEISVDGAVPPCPSAQAAESACVTIPPPALRIEWPASEVHVPARFAMDEILVRARLGSASIWGLLDSGAELTAIDVTTKRGAGFRPAASTIGAGVSETLSVGLGRLDQLSLGALLAEHVPVVAVPIPALSAFGELRPDVIFGFSFFLGATVRIDRGKGEIVFARAPTPLHGKDALAIPLSLRGGAYVATVEVDGRKADCVLDTGSSSGISLDARWAKDNGLLEGPTTQVKARTGAGTGAALETLARARRASLGGLAIDAPLISTIPMPAPGDVVGLVGNPVFGMCRAVTFDPAARTLWLDPPCAPRISESRAHWRLEPNGDATRWNVANVVPGGSAERAGIRVGDEIVRVDDLALRGDPSILLPVFRKPTGTRVSVVVRRDGVLRTIGMTLVDLLPLENTQ